MIDPGHPRLSIVRQCELASISRSSFYREPTAENEATLRLMRRIDETVPGDALVRLAADGAAFAPQRLVRWAPSRPSSDAQDGFGADLPTPKDEPTASAASYMAISASPSDHRSAEPGLVRRRDLHPDAPRLPIPGRDHGLVQPQGSGMEAIEHDGC